MAAYIVATVTISDPVRFGDYVKAIAGVAETFGGEYLVRGKVSEVLEGDTDTDERIVVLRFPDEASARGYIRGERYEAGKALRTGAGTVGTRLIVDPA